MNEGESQLEGSIINDCSLLFYGQGFIRPGFKNIKDLCVDKIKVPFNISLDSFAQGREWDLRTKSYCGC